jgi:hypothetical protein
LLLIWACVIPPPGPRSFLLTSSISLSASQQHIRPYRRPQEELPSELRARVSTPSTFQSNASRLGTSTPTSRTLQAPYPFAIAYSGGLVHQHIPSATGTKEINEGSHDIDDEDVQPSDRTQSQDEESYIPCSPSATLSLECSLSRRRECVRHQSVEST